MGAQSQYWADYPDRGSLEEAILSQMHGEKPRVHVELIGQPAIYFHVTEHVKDIVLGVTEGNRNVTIDLRYQSVTIE